MFMSGSTRAPTHLTGRDIQLCDSESPLLPANLQVLSWERGAGGGDLIKRGEKWAGRAGESGEWL